MNSLLYYYNNVQKMAAYRQAKRMQRGAFTAQGWFNSESTELLNVPCTIQSVFIAKRDESSFQEIFSTGANNTIMPTISGRDYVQLTGGGVYYIIEDPFDRILDVVFVVKTDGIEVYVDGDKVAEGSADISSLTWYYLGNYKTNTSYKFQGDYLLHRHFNYAMSEDEVKALDNNGDPMGYVAPKAMRDSLLAEYLPQNLMSSRKGPAVELTGYWLDSAKQLPLSDEYMEPLFQSIGGYDMTANGAPEILYNE